MAVRLSGIPVAREMRGRIQAGVEQLHQIGQIPTMGIVRVGARPEDISYETGATKLAQSLGIAVSRTLLPGDVGERQLLEVLREVNENQRIHGCLLFRPLPAHLNTRAVLGALSSGKDIDAMTGASMGGLILPGMETFPPCTAAACLELLRFYQISLPGKHVAIVGTGADRSPVTMSCWLLPLLTALLTRLTKRTGFRCGTARSLLKNSPTELLSSKTL